MKIKKKKKIILNDQVFYILSTAIVILIVIVIKIQLQSLAESLITQSACVYLDLLPHVKRMLTELYAGNQYFIIQ